MSTTATRPRFTRHADEYAVSTTIAETTVYLGTVRLVGQTWIAYPQAGDQGSHLYVNEHRTRANAAAALDTAMRAALAADSAEALTETDCTAQPVWASGGPGKSAYSDYRWECGCGHRYGNATPADGDVSAQHAAHLAEDAAQDVPEQLAPGMYRVKITVTNRDGVHSATEDMNPAAITLARSRPGWTVEILGESLVTVVEDEPAESASQVVARETLAARERELRAAVAALPADYLARVGLATPEAVERHVADELAEEAEVLGVSAPVSAPAATSHAAYCQSCDCTYAAVMSANGPAIAYEYEPDGFTVSGIRHVCWPRDQRVGRLVAARRAARGDHRVRVIRPAYTVEVGNRIVLDDAAVTVLEARHDDTARTVTLVTSYGAPRTVTFDAAVPVVFGTDPRAVAGTPENIDARADARARGERADQIGLGFDLDDRQAMAEAQVRAKTGGELTLFG